MDNIAFKVNDGELDSNTKTQTINVEPINDAPVANDITNQSTDETELCN